MSITDELREWAARELAGWKMARERFDALTAIADRIDAEHENAMAGAALIAGVPMTDEHMAEHGWIRMPMDADGEPINIGDVMVYEDNTKPMAVIALVPPAVFITEEGPLYADMCLHYHAPTVEDVLREFARECLTYATCVDDHEVQDAIEMYSAKLRLTDDGKEQ